MPKDTRARFLFRGHASFEYQLVTTLDRERPFQDDRLRQHFYQDMLAEFWREAMQQVSIRDELPAGDALELLARHHGVPSPILDWTESPYIAAFFAFESSKRLWPPATSGGHSIAIFVLDLMAFDPDRGVTMIEDRELIRFNRRALRQRGRFARVETIQQPVEEILSGALTKIIVPAQFRSIALADLDAMTINAANLFADLDGAARTARFRLLDEPGATR
ncbi:MAG TPA: FRG domain-containing protein [Isosphaeraceae bacterium]|nr:FRG domain-containing protein [Isosphaeraceae bacterium]